MKCAYQKFNQVDLYQSQQWLNGTGQKGGGIVGITKTPSPSSRWALFYNTLSNIATEHEKCFAQILTTPSLTTNATDNVDENWRSQEMKTSSHSHHCESFRDRKGSIAQPCWIRWPHGVWFDLFLGRRQPEIVLESFPAVPRSAEITWNEWSHRGTGALIDNTPRNAELFICKIYSAQNCNAVNMAQSITLRRDRTPKALPPARGEHFSHRAAPLSGSSLATSSFAPTTTPSNWDHGMGAWEQYAGTSS